MLKKPASARLALFQSGLTLIELMIAIAVLAFLLLIGLPSFGELMTNLRIRSVGESVLSGLKIAQMEAIKQNKPIRFELSGLGLDWVVTNPEDTDSVLARSDFGKTNVVGYRFPALSACVTFNSFGQAVDQSCLPAHLQKIDLSVPPTVLASPRNLRILIEANGALKLCDPNTPSGDPRAC